MTLTKGEFASGDIWLKQGAPAGKGKQQHQLSVDNLTAHVTQEKEGWQFAFPIRASRWTASRGRAVR
jgi:uncharacterized protein YhdP